MVKKTKYPFKKSIDLTAEQGRLIEEIADDEKTSANAVVRRGVDLAIAEWNRKKERADT